MSCELSACLELGHDLEQYWTRLWRQVTSVIYEAILNPIRFRELSIIMLYEKCWVLTYSLFMQIFNGCTRSSYGENTFWTGNIWVHWGFPVEMFKSDNFYILISGDAIWVIKRSKNNRMFLRVLNLLNFPKFIVAVLYVIMLSWAVL